MKAVQSKNIIPANSNHLPFFQKESNNFFSKNSKPFFNEPAIQPKLTVNEPGDKYEQEADAMADKVVQRLSNNESHFSDRHGSSLQATPGPQIKPVNSPLPLGFNNGLQAKCATCEQEDKLQQKEEKEDEIGFPASGLQMKPVFESNAGPLDEETNMQRKCAECENEGKKEIQTKAENSGSESNTAPIESYLSSSKGTGTPLPENTRTQMERSFDADFSNVRIHNDSKAVQMNKALNAQAFTHTNDIYFNANKYDTGSTAGKHLLAHELTHTVQQGASAGKQPLINKTEERIQCIPQAGFVPPVTDKQARYFGHRDDVVDIQGQSTFKPGSGLANYIASLWENGQEAAVNIKFGSMAVGYIFVKGPATLNEVCLDIPLGLFGPDISICKDIPPQSENYQAQLQVIPVHHDAFKSNYNGSVVLAVRIVNGIIYGELGWVTGKSYADIDPVMDAETVSTSEESFLPLIYGTDYDGANYTSSHFTNMTVNGDLYFDLMGELQLPNQQKIQGIFIINNNLFRWKGNLIGHPKGLEEYNIPIQRSADAVLTGDATSLALDANWTVGNPNEEHGKFTASGQLRISYQNGVLDIFGKATYASARINGEVNVAVTQESKAKELFTQHAPATKSKGTAGPGPLPVAQEENPQEPLALTAWGNLSFKLIDTKKATAGAAGKKNPLSNLEGEGAFSVSPEGYIILAGKVKFPARWLLTGELNYRSDDADDASKHLFEHETTLVRAAVPYGTANLELGITIDADAHLDPLELYEIEIAGVYSNHPDYRSEVDITPHFYISGNVGAVVKVKAEGAYKLGGIIKLISASGDLTGTARAKAYIDAQPTIKKIWDGGDAPATYAVEGTIYTGGKITFTLTGSINVRVLGGKIWKTDDYEIGSWTLADFGAMLKMNEYIIGSGETPDFDYSKMGFSSKERKKLGKAIAAENEGKAGVDDKRTGGFEQIEDGKKKEKGTFSDEPPVRPDEDAEPITNKLEEDFLMKDQLHELILSFSGTRKTPAALIEMASGDKKPLTQKIEEEKSILEAQKMFSDADTEKQLDTQKRDIEAIEGEAANVAKNAVNAAQKTQGDEEPVVAGFDQLDDRLSSYAKKYNLDDLGLGTATPTPPPGVIPALQVPRVVGADPKLEQLLTDKRAEVGYTGFDNFRSSNVAVFRYYVLKPGAKQIDSLADGPFYETAVNVAKELHSEQIIAGNLQAIQQSASFRKKYGPTHIIAVNQVLSERSPCSMCRDFLVNNPSKLVSTSNDHTYYLVHYSGNWIVRNRALMIRYGLQPPSLAELQKTYGGRDLDPH